MSRTVKRITAVWVAACAVAAFCGAADIDGAMALLTMLLVSPMAYVAGVLATVDRRALAQRP